MAAMSAISQGSSAGFGAGGAYLQGVGEQGAYNNAASVASNNATLALQAGVMDARRQRMLSSEKIGAIRAAYGASGVTTDNGGSVADVLGAHAANAELDQLNILHGATVRAINFENQAELDKSAGDNAMKSAYFNATSSFLLGGAKSYEAYRGSKNSSFSFDDKKSSGKSEEEAGDQSDGEN